MLTAEECARRAAGTTRRSRFAKMQREMERKKVFGRARWPGEFIKKFALMAWRAPRRVRTVTDDDVIENDPVIASSCPRLNIGHAKSRRDGGGETINAH